jgi:hypothetical protein
MLNLSSGQISQGSENMFCNRTRCVRSANIHCGFSSKLNKFVKKVQERLRCLVWACRLSSSSLSYIRCSFKPSKVLVFLMPSCFVTSAFIPMSIAQLERFIVPALIFMPSLLFQSRCIVSRNRIACQCSFITTNAPCSYLDFVVYRIRHDTPFDNSDWEIGQDST